MVYAARRNVPRDADVPFARSRLIRRPRYLPRASRRRHGLLSADGFVPNRGEDRRAKACPLLVGQEAHALIVLLEELDRLDRVPLGLAVSDRDVEDPSQEGQRTVDRGWRHL